MLCPLSLFLCKNLLDGQARGLFLLFHLMHDGMCLLLESFKSLLDAAV